MLSERLLVPFTSFTLTQSKMLCLRLEYPMSDKSQDEKNIPSLKITHRPKTWMVGSDDPASFWGKRLIFKGDGDGC